MAGTGETVDFTEQTAGLKGLAANPEASDAAVKEAFLSMVIASEEEAEEAVGILEAHRPTVARDIEEEFLRTS